MPDPQEFQYRSSDATWDFTILLPPLLRTLRRIPAHGRVLDIGCGNGAIIRELQKHGDWHFQGVESSASAVRICQEVGLEVVYCPDASKQLTEVMPLDTFDFVFATEVVEHLYNPPCFVAQAIEVLKPNGVLLLSTPYHGWLKNTAIAVTGHWDRHHDSLWTGGHIKFWSKRTLSQLLLNAGFLDLSFHGVGRIPWLWKSMIMTARRPS